MSDLPRDLRVKADMIMMCERIPFGSEAALMEMAANEIERLQQSNAELTAHVELINKAWLCPYPECIMDELNEVINKTPAQCLTKHDREVAARAVEDGFIAGFKYRSEVAALRKMWADSEIREFAYFYANKIKTGDVEI